MKILRKISVIAIVFSLLLSGCGSKNKEHKYLDFSNEFFTQYCDLSVSPSDGGYYYAVNGYMYYMDTDKNSIVPVCSKVDCTHNSSTCDAYIGRTGIWFGSIQYYDGSLYKNLGYGEAIQKNYERAVEITKNATNYGMSAGESAPGIQYLTTPICAVGGFIGGVGYWVGDGIADMFRKGQEVYINKGDVLKVKLINPIDVPVY